MSQKLAYPVYVARLLQRENLIPKEVVTSIVRKLSLSRQRRALLKSVQDAVSTDHRNLLIFSTVLEKVNGNESLANDILNDYSKCYYNNYVHYCVIITR